MRYSANTTEGNNDISDFVLLLNKSVSRDVLSSCHSFLDKLAAPHVISELNINLRLYSMLGRLQSLTEKHKPASYTGCRFGNKAFFTWLNEISMIYDDLFEEYGILQSCKSQDILSNIKRHFLHSFGNDKRLDYGTGHELEFIYFLRELYSVGIIEDSDLKFLVLIVINRYFELIRYLLGRYTLEPAGTKGCWGIDDYQYLPFIFGSSQLISNKEIQPFASTKREVVEKYKDEYIFMRAMEYKIMVSKDTPLNISSPMICNILSSCSWDKINAGLLKLYIDDINRFKMKNILV